MYPLELYAKAPPCSGGVSPSLANEKAPALTSHAPTVTDRRYRPATVAAHAPTVTDRRYRPGSGFENFHLIAVGVGDEGHFARPGGKLVFPS